MLRVIAFSASFGCRVVPVAWVAGGLVRVVFLFVLVFGDCVLVRVFPVFSKCGLVPCSGFTWRVWVVHLGSAASLLIGLGYGNGSDARWWLVWSAFFAAV